MSKWDNIQMEIARQHFRERIFSENKQFRNIRSASEGLARTRTAKQKHAAMLALLNRSDPDEISDADDSSIYRSSDI